jgi:phosphoribosyl 1,2-cyclic phosphodiesterase
LNVTVLGSGSGGNSTLVEADGVRILLDAGFSGRDIETRLRGLDVEPESIAGIVITHDHGDHTRGAGVLARRFGIPVYMTRATLRACASLLNGQETIRQYASSRPFRIGGIEVHPFVTVHDAADPVAVTVRDVRTGIRMGLVTDVGRPTAAMRAELAGCDMLVLEANHDDALLWNGPYPWSVKQRIASSHGHLSNRAAARLIRELYHPGLAAVALAHLSEHCNTASLASQVVGRALDRLGFRGWLKVADQAVPTETVDLVSARKRGAPAQLDLFRS